jgi:hypothetical protein
VAERYCKVTTGYNPRCAEALVRAGCDVGVKSSNGMTGRQIAEECGHTAVVERLRAVVAEQLRAALVRRTPSWPRSWANFSCF